MSKYPHKAMKVQPTWPAIENSYEEEMTTKESQFFARMDINILQQAGLLTPGEAISLLKMITSKDKENLVVALEAIKQKINNFKE